ncbi:PDZK1-interacting protein 1 isoform X2 [Cottoperca gobio]|uniref:PDZK1-interacting protein 1 isoform X2 n=1 Tax=Cottoperca gobio TaxID=56716 RepID=A0A6J2PGH2_COTGO|nr:PDZK1-interacting protein 1 isoform X2 [Cottoperca gobio]
MQATNCSEVPAQISSAKGPAMGTSCAAISCLLLSVGAVTAQTAQSQMSERALPQWLTGIIAVSGFLFLSFVGFLVKKAWCEKHNRIKTTVESVRENDYVITDENTYETSLDMVSKEDMNAYDNLVIDCTEDKVTTM